jgi:hypothetical protein
MAKITLIETEAQGIFRDKSSMALINTDKAAYVQYKSQRAKAGTVNQLSNEVQSLKQDMVEIKQMIIQLAEVKSNG